MGEKVTERKFEEHIEEHLLNSGYRKRRPEDYDKDLCLIPGEVIQFIQATQPKEYAKLQLQVRCRHPQQTLLPVVERDP